MAAYVLCVYDVCCVEAWATAHASTQHAKTRHFLMYRPPYKRGPTPFASNQWITRHATVLVCTNERFGYRVWWRFVTFWAFCLTTWAGRRESPHIQMCLMFWLNANCDVSKRQDKTHSGGTIWEVQLQTECSTFKELSNRLYYKGN